MTVRPFDAATQLYDLLPRVYRDRDVRRTGQDPHLLAYLGALGPVLDRVRLTLEQRYDDSFPDTSVPGHRCQDWLIPYFADLFAVTLRSPFPDGQRSEVANAVRWAQRKGTLQAVEEVIEAILQTEAEVQEGWRRVATTARIGLPLASALSTGAAAPMPPDPAYAGPEPTASEIARHPALPAVTPDLRRASRAIRATPGTPGSHATRFGRTSPNWPLDDPAQAGDAALWPAPADWRQANPHGAPCFPGSYEDVSRRTPDLRDPGRGRGRFHPRRLLIHIPPPYGLCPPAPLEMTWAELQAPTGDIVERIDDAETGAVLFRNKTAASVRITDAVDVSGLPTASFEKLRLEGGLVLGPGDVTLHRCAVSRIDAAAAGGEIALTDCLVGTIAAAARTVRAEYVTVLQDCETQILLASDCIFGGTMDLVNVADCVRFSRVPQAYLDAAPPASQENALTTEPPVFQSAVFGAEGAGVLSRETAEAITRGAEDGGEMGAFHAWRYIAGIEALAAKLADYLPIGVTPSIEYDPRLLCPPPRLT